MKIVIIFLFIIWIKICRQEKNDPKSLIPEDLSQELFCVGCIVLAVETAKILNGKKGESDVYHALSIVCKQEYKTYRKLEKFIQFFLRFRLVKLVKFFKIYMTIIKLKNSSKQEKTIMLSTLDYAIKKQM